MSPFRRKRKPTDDPTSIGNILTAAGIVSTMCIVEALNFQKDNADVLMGEVLVHLGKLTREQLEAVVTQQKALRTNKPRDARALVELATKRTHIVAEAFAEVTDKIAAIPRTKNA